LYLRCSGFSTAQSRTGERSDLVAWNRDNRAERERNDRVAPLAGSAFVPFVESRRYV
jgi:hypothetical protein